MFLHYRKNNLGLMMAHFTKYQNFDFNCIYDVLNMVIIKHNPESNSKYW